MKRLLFALLLFACVANSRADSIPYTQIGKVAAQTTVYASSSSGIDLFFSGSSGGYTDYVGVYDLKTGYNTGLLFDSKTTAVGTEAVVGAGPGQINAGDQLILFLDSPEGIFTSSSAYSADGINHAYITSFAGSKLNGVQVPAGLFVGMEDEALSHSDLNYNDEDFIVTNVTTSVTPEPSSLALLGTGFIGLFVPWFRRRFARSTAD